MSNSLTQIAHYIIMKIFRDLIKITQTLSMFSELIF